MPPMIFDTQGTGFYKRAARQMMAQKEIPYLSGGLGDEIMLLEGLDDLAAAYPHGYDDGPARTYTMPTMDRGTLYDFSTGAVEVGLSGSRLGAPLAANQNAWRQDDSFRYTGLGAQPGWPAQQSRYAKRRYRFTGPKLGQVNINRGRYAYTGLNALGDAQSDARMAMLTANGIKTAGLLVCNALNTEADKRTCRSGVESAFEMSRAAIVAAFGTDGTTPAPGGSTGPTPAEQAAIDAALNRQADRSGVDRPIETEDNTMLYVGGAVAVVAVLAAAYIIAK